MDDLIRREDIRTALKENVIEMGGDDWCEPGVHCGDIDAIVDSVPSAVCIDSAPSIDIVYCSECKYKQQCRKAVEYIIHEPTSVTIGYKSISFCSYGEREEE